MSWYQSLRAYSPTHDCYVYRISMCNEHAHELFMLIPDDSGPKTLRARRAAALDAIQEAIDAGCDPGQVRVSPDAWRRMVDDALAEAV